MENNNEFFLIIKFYILAKQQEGLPDYGWSFSYKGESLTLIKPLLFNSLWDAYWKTSDFTFRSKRKDLKEKEYFEKFISERQKNEIIAEKITSTFLENFSSASLLFASISQNADIKNSFEYYFPNRDPSTGLYANTRYGIYMRNKNYENNLIAFNKIGFIINDSNKNLLLAGIELDKINEASDFFDKQIRLFNMKKADNEKLNIFREEKLIYAPFISWIYKYHIINENGVKQENTFGISGRSEYSKEARNFKVNCYYGYSVKNVFDLITKVKYKRLEMRKLNTLEETQLFKRRVHIFKLKFKKNIHFK